MTSPTPATTFATQLVGVFSSLGVRHAVVAPGSRSQALALALASLDEQGIITLHVRIDERVAAFTALGLAVETGEPTLVVTTSGTAVANLLPAVVEASHTGVPMILLTADRPAALRGTGANQTTWQAGMFGRFVRECVDVPPPRPGAIPDVQVLASAAYEKATGPDAGPVQLNLQFVEPLSGGEVPLQQIPVGSVPTRAVGDDSLTFPLTPGPRTVVIAGAGAGEAAADVAAQGGWPLIAEVSSGSHFGPELVVAYRDLLGDPAFGERVERAVVFGHPTLSREVPALLARSEVEVIIVRAPGEPFVPRLDALVVDAVTVEGADPADRAARAWRGQWVFASRELLEQRTEDVPGPHFTDSGSEDIAERRAFARAEMAALRAPVTRSALALAAWRATWPHDRLVLGASRLIRELDLVAPGKKIRVHSNRGLAGIDGTIATATGIALASQASDRSASARPGTTRLLLGDIAVLHDVGALLLGRGETRPRLQVIVGYDGGGSIFDGLEAAATADPAAFDRVMFTPHEVDLASLAAAYGWEHRRVEHRVDLDSVLSTPPSGPVIIEATLPR